MNPIQLALYYGNKLLLQYFLEQRGESLHLAFIKSDRDEIGMMTICIDRKNLEVFDYLINGYPAHWWSYSRLKSVYDQCINRKWTEGINAIIQGSTLKAVFRSFTVRGRLQIIEDIFEPLITYNTLLSQFPIKKVVAEQIVQQPFLSVTFFKIIKGAYAELQEDRNKHLKIIKKDLLRTDILNMCTQLKLHIVIEDFYKELNTQANLYEKGLLADFIVWVKGTLRQDVIANFTNLNSDLFIQSRTGSIQQFEVEVAKLEIKTLERVRGVKCLEIDLCTMEHSIDTVYWGPLLWSLYSGNHHLF